MWLKNNCFFNKAESKKIFFIEKFRLDEVDAYSYRFWASAPYSFGTGIFRQLPFPAAWADAGEYNGKYWTASRHFKHTLPIKNTDAGKCLPVWRNCQKSAPSPRFNRIL